MRLLKSLSISTMLLAKLTTTAPMDSDEGGVESSVSRDAGLITIDKRDLTSQFIDQSVRLNDAQSACIYSATPYLREGVVQFRFKVPGTAEGLAMNASTGINLVHVPSAVGPTVSLVPVSAIDALLELQSVVFTPQKAQVIATNFQTSNILYHILPEHGQVQRVQGDISVYELDHIDRNAPPELMILASVPGLSERSIDNVDLPRIHCLIVCPEGHRNVYNESSHYCGCHPPIKPTDTPRRDLELNVNNTESLFPVIKPCPKGCPRGTHCVRGTFQGQKGYCKANVKSRSPVPDTTDSDHGIAHPCPGGCPPGSHCVGGTFQGQNGYCVPNGKPRSPAPEIQGTRTEDMTKKDNENRQLPPEPLPRRTLGPGPYPGPTPVEPFHHHPHDDASSLDDRGIVEVDQYSATADESACLSITCIATGELALYNPYTRGCFCGTDPGSEMVKRGEVDG